MFISWGLRLIGGVKLFGQDRSDAAADEAASEKGEGEDEPAPWVPVLIIFDQIQAVITLDALATEGIPARLRQEAANRAIPVNVGLLGKIEVLVPEPKLEHARRVVEVLTKTEIQYEIDETIEEDFDTE